MIRPVRDKVLCRVLDCRPKQTAAGVLLPDTQRGREDQAVVLAVGSGGEDKKGHRVAPGVAPGDKVYFDPYHCEWTENQGTVASCYASPGELMLIREKHLLGVITEGD